MFRLLTLFVLLGVAAEAYGQIPPAEEVPSEDQLLELIRDSLQLTKELEALNDTMRQQMVDIEPGWPDNAPETQAGLELQGYMFEQPYDELEAEMDTTLKLLYLFMVMRNEADTKTKRGWTLVKSESVQRKEMASISDRESWIEMIKQTPPQLRVHSRARQKIFNGYLELLEAIGSY